MCSPSTRLYTSLLSTFSVRGIYITIIMHLHLHPNPLPPPPPLHHSIIPAITLTNSSTSTFPSSLNFCNMPTAALSPISSVHTLPRPWTCSRALLMLAGGCCDAAYTFSRCVRSVGDCRSCWTAGEATAAAKGSLSFGIPGSETAGCGRGGSGAGVSVAVGGGPVEWAALWGL